LPGKDGIYDLEKGTMTLFDTALGAPAHFEVDGDDIYVSSHNFVFFERRYLLGPAAIEKIHLNEDGTIERKGTFSHRLGYRYTSHRVFHV